jgi:hypothetical protein
MGPQRVLQAAVAVASVAFARAPASAAPRAGERIAVIDLGAGAAAATDDVQRTLARAVSAAGLAPVTEDGLDDALAGRDVALDAAELAAALATAQRAFGELRCTDAVPAARQAIGIAAARQAAGLAVPELARAWTYVLLCADRDGQLDAALTAASRLRAISAGQRPDDVPASVWTRYPAVDAVSNAELLPLDIDADAPGAAIWIDFQRVGASPVHVALPAGDHVIAAAAGSRRGWAAGTAVRSQRAIHVPTRETAGRWREVAQRVAGWRGKPPAPDEIAWLLGRVHARIALVRAGATITAWGQPGRAEPPRLIGGDAGTAPITDVDRVLGLIADRVHAWNDHAPDPDRPLLTEATVGPERSGRTDEGDKPTKWWVYAAIGTAAAIGGVIILVHAAGSDRQRVELHYP